MNQQLSIKIIRELEKAPEQSQRALSKRCGVSLGSIHYCMNALVEKGYVKATNFKNAQKKLAYAYILTPAGINLKKELTLAFLRRKQAEYEALQLEIRALENDLAHITDPHQNAQSGFKPVQCFSLVSRVLGFGGR